MTIAFTLVNIAYLPMAKTLADSFIQNNPEIPFYICLFDDKHKIKEPIFLEYNIYDKNNLNSEEYDDMRSRYDNFSMACALKPFFSEALIKDFNPEKLIYLDADIKVFHNFEKVQNILNNDASIVLTGHLYTMIPDEKELSSNQEIRKYGLYNAGFFAIKTNESGTQFLNWWKRILFKKCIQDDENGIYYDQTWLDLVPIYFKDTFVLRDLGYNIAYWNLKERTISSRNGKYFVNENIPLVFYHFARYQNNLPSTDKVESFDSLTETEALILNYHKELVQNKFEEYTIESFKKSTFRDKIKISLKYRLGLLIDKL